MTFTNSATADTDSLDVEGGSGDGGPNVSITFRNSSSAGNGDFSTKAARLGPTLQIGR